MAEVWDRRLDETSKAFAAFVAYRDLGPKRSTALVVQELGKSRALISRWSARHEWVERATAFEERVDGARQGTYLDEISKMAERHARYAQSGLEALMAPIRELQRRIALEKIDFTKIDDEQLLTISRLSAAALANVANLERLTRGLPTERTSGDEDAAAELAGAREKLEAVLERIAEARERQQEDAP